MTVLNTQLNNTWHDALGLGFAPSEWQGDVGSVIVIRQIGEELDRK